MFISFPSHLFLGFLRREVSARVSDASKRRRKRGRENAKKQLQAVSQQTCSLDRKEGREREREQRRRWMEKKGERETVMRQRLCSE